MMAAMKIAARDREAIVAGIKDAERGNIGEVRVHIEDACPKGDALARARSLFSELGMQRTRRGTGVLLYVAVKDRKAAVFAGPGIHDTATEGFWRSVVDGVSAGYRKGEPIAGVCRALAEIGELLREHAAGEDVDGNELPDQVSTS
jgi:uncharacterized membrane protein